MRNTLTSIECQGTLLPLVSAAVSLGILFNFPIRVLDSFEWLEVAEYEREMAVGRSVISGNHPQLIGELLLVEHFGSVAKTMLYNAHSVNRHFTVSRATELYTAGGTEYGNRRLEKFWRAMVKCCYACCWGLGKGGEGGAFEYAKRV